MLRAALTVSRNDLHEEPQQLRRGFDAAARRLALLELRADPHGRAADLHEVRCPIVSGASDRKDYRYEVCLANVRILMCTNAWRSGRVAQTATRVPCLMDVLVQREDVVAQILAVAFQLEHSLPPRT
jgi:hypothetical protein